MWEEKNRRSGIPLAWFLILVILMTAISFGQSTEDDLLVSGTRSEYSGPYVTADMIPAEAHDLNVYCPNGSSPIIDGSITGDDGWTETPRTVQVIDDGTIHIRSKHDADNIYFLIETWDCVNPEDIYMEDDGLYPDGVLDQNDDGMYVGVSGFPDGYRDAHGPSWSVDGQHGGADGSGSSSYFISEWWKPLNSGDEYDINVSSDEVLGLGIGRVNGAGEWPYDYDNYDSATYGKLHVIYDDYPGNVSLIFPANNSHIQPGIKIVFAVSGSIMGVQYSTNGADYMTLYDPYLIHTMSWKEGDKKLFIDIYFEDGYSISRTYDFVIDGSPPTFEGITTVEPFTNRRGAVLSWNEASDLTPPIEYQIHISDEEEHVFSPWPSYVTIDTDFTLTGLEPDRIYHFGVRAADGLGLTDKNERTISLSTSFVPTPYPGLDPTQIEYSAERNEVYALLGGTPVCNGEFNSYFTDKWFETPETFFDIGEDRIIISAKHDIEHLYILITSESLEIDEYRIYINDGEEGKIEQFDADLKLIRIGKYRNDLYSSADPEYPWYEDRGTDEISVEAGSESDLQIVEFCIDLSDESGEDLNINGNRELDLALELIDGDEVHTWPENADLHTNSSSSWGRILMIFDYLPIDVEMISPGDGQIIPPYWDFRIEVYGGICRSIQYRLDDGDLDYYDEDIRFENMGHGGHNLSVVIAHYRGDPLEFRFPFRVDASTEKVRGLDFEETDDTGVYRIFWDPVDDESEPVSYLIFNAGVDDYFSGNDYIETHETEIIMNLLGHRKGDHTNIFVIAIDAFDNINLDLETMIRIDHPGEEIPDGDGGEEEDETPPSPLIIYPRISSPASRSSYSDIEIHSDDDTEWMEVYVRKNGEWIMLHGTAWTSSSGIWRVDIDLSEWEWETLDIKVIAGDHAGNEGEYILENIPVLDDEEDENGESISGDALRDLMYIPIIVLTVILILVILMILFFALIKRDHDLIHSGETVKQKGENERTTIGNGDDDTPSDDVITEKVSSSDSHQVDDNEE